MLPLRFPWVWWLLGWSLVGGVIVFSLIPGNLVPGLWLRDKALHALTYFLLMVWFSGLYRRQRHWLIALFVFLLGFALDLAQGLTRSRFFDLDDVAANAGGILVGLVLARYVFEAWCWRVEQILLRRS